MRVSLRAQATGIISEIYASEQWYDRLFDHLMHAQYDLLSALAMYIRFFNEDQQPQLVQRLGRLSTTKINNERRISELAQGLPSRDRGRQ